MKKTLLALAAVLALVGGAHAVTLTQTGTVLTVEYNEPTTNEDGSPLIDLAGTRITYQIGTDTPVVGALIPATSPNGGGHIRHDLNVPVVAGQEVTVTVTITAEDEVPNVSAPTDPETREIDRKRPGRPN